MTHTMSAAFIAAVIGGIALMRLATTCPSRSVPLEALLAAMLCSG